MSQVSQLLLYESASQFRVKICMVLYHCSKQAHVKSTIPHNLPHLALLPHHDVHFPTITNFIIDTLNNKFVMVRIFYPITLVVIDKVLFYGFHHIILRYKEKPNIKFQGFIPQPW